MSEFPKAYPNLRHFVSASQVLRLWQLNDLTHNGRIDYARLTSDIAEIWGLMTPPDILDKPEHNRYIIDPIEYRSFDSLRASRQQIRDLQLAPIRTEEVQAEYEKMSNATFLDVVKKHYLGDSLIALVREMYRYNLPADVDQLVVWDFAERENWILSQFIALYIQHRGLTTDDIILFERSRNSSTDLVRVRVPQIRHVHLWTRASV